MKSIYGDANPNSKSSRLARANSSTKPSFIEFMRDVGEKEIEIGHWQSAQRIVEFMADYFTQDPDCESAVDYLANLMASHQEQERITIELYQARAQLKASEDTRIPVPRFGTLERAQYDNERRIASENGTPQISKAQFQQDLRAQIQTLELETSK